MCAASCSCACAPCSTSITSPSAASCAATSLKRVDGTAGLRVGAVVAFGGRGERRLRAVDQRLRMGEAPVVGLQRLPFVVARGELVDLAELPGEAFALAGQLGLAAGRRLDRIGRGAPARPGGGERRGVDMRLGVEQLAHGGGARQPLPGMLAVDLDQMLGHLAQLRHGRRAAVDPGAALALRIDHPPHQQRIVGRDGVEAGRFQPAGKARRPVELGADLGPRRALAHHAGVAAAAEGELQRVDQDRLAGAGLAGEHGEARAEVEFERRHDHEIAQREASQHGRRAVRLALPAPAFRHPRSSAAWRAAWRSSSSRADA